MLVGAGPTGTEMAGTLGDMIHRSLKEEYPNLPLNEAGIHVVDMGHSVLSAFSPKAQAYAAKMLEERGVKIHLGTAVKEVGEGSRGAVRRKHESLPTRWSGQEVCAPLTYR